MFVNGQSYKSICIYNNKVLKVIFSTLQTFYSTVYPYQYLREIEAIFNQGPRGLYSSFVNKKLRITILWHCEFKAMEHTMLLLGREKMAKNWYCGRIYLFSVFRDVLKYWICRQIQSQMITSIKIYLPSNRFLDIKIII